MILEVIRYLEPYYEEYEQELANINISDLPLMAGPLPVFLIISAYLIFVLWIGPWFMSSRKPYNVQKLILYYNASQIILNIISIYLIMKGKNRRNELFESFIKPSDKRRFRMTQEDVCLMWIFFSLKLLDLLDTVFFVLKKNFRQITFLHVYHHSSVCLYAWFITKYLPVEQCILFGLLNCIVHSFMYTYYLLSSLGPEYKKYLFWKKYLTMLQLAQFFIMVIYFISSTIVAENNLLKLPSYLNFFYASTFIFLFSNFFLKTYKKKEK